MKLFYSFMIIFVIGIIFVSGCAKDVILEEVPVEESVTVPESVVVYEPVENMETAVPAEGGEPVEDMIVGFEEESQAHQVEMTTSGFVPETLSVKKGDIVTFANKDTNKHWPASANHPSHTVYPGSSVSKCGTSEADSIFDACKGLEEGESYSFIFNEVGSWGYHDHLRSGIRGSIVVE